MLRLVAPRVVLVECAGVCLGLGAVACALPEYATGDRGSGGAHDGGVVASSSGGSGGSTVTGGAGGVDPLLGFVDAVQSDKPLAWWRFAPDSTVVAKDVTGHGNDCTYLGGPTITPTQDGDGVVSLDGTDQAIDCGVIFPFTGAVPYSMEAIITPPGDQMTEYRKFFSKEEGDTPLRQGYDGTLHYDASGQFVASFERFNPDLTTSFCGVDGPVTAGQRTHIVMSYDGSRSRLYLNGAVYESSDCMGQTINEVTASFAIGRYSGGAYGFLHATYDEFVVYGVALTPARVAVHCSSAGLCP